MKVLSHFLFTLVVSCLLCSNSQAQSFEQPDSPRFDQQANLLYCISGDDGDDEIHLVRKPKEESFQVNFVRDAKTLLSFSAHNRTVFEVVKNVVYYVYFNVLTSGYTVFAYDLQQEKELWHTNLQALGFVNYSFYFNIVNIGADESFIWVVGKESAGNYFEKLDAKTGKTILNRKLD